MAESHSKAHRPPFDCLLIGDEALLVRCAEHLRTRGHRICGIVSADKQITDWSRAHDVLLMDPERYEEAVQDLTFDYLFSIANLRLIPDAVLHRAKRAAINFHDGPLPEYAGLNVTSWAIINQEPTHAVTWHYMEAGVDTGDVLIRRPIDVAPDETAFTLNTKCFEAGLNSFEDLIQALETDAVDPVPQDLSQRTYYGRNQPPPCDGVVPWRWTADRIDALVRGLDFGGYRNPLGTPKCLIDDEAYQIEQLDVLPQSSERAPGTVAEADEEQIVIATGSHDVALRALQTLDGEDVSLRHVAVQHGLEKGDRLPVLTEAHGRQLEERAATLKRNEAFWVKQLETAPGLDLPFVRGAASRDEAERATQEQTVHGVDALAAQMGAGTASADTTVAALAAYLARLTQRDTFSIGYLRDEYIRDEEEPLYASPCPSR